MMKQTRRSRHFTVIFSLWVLLFAQFALAGYRCLETGGEPPQLAGAHADMACAELMTIAQDEPSGMCHAHCQVGEQRVDNSQPPTAVALRQIATGLTVEAAEPVQHMRPQRRAWRPPSGLPLTVQNCCFRI